MFAQPGFAQIDGTSNDDTGNSVMPRIELLGGTIAASVPVPALSDAMLAALALLLAGGSYFALRRRS